MSYDDPASVSAPENQGEILAREIGVAIALTLAVFGFGFIATEVISGLLS